MYQLFLNSILHVLKAPYAEKKITPLGGKMIDVFMTRSCVIHCTFVSDGQDPPSSWGDVSLRKQVNTAAVPPSHSSRDALLHNAVAKNKASTE